MSVLHLCTWVHLIAVNVGATVAAADAGEGGDGVPVAITVTEKKKRQIHIREKIYSQQYGMPFFPTLFYLYESRLLIVSCPESSCSSPATLKHTFFPFRSPFSPSLSADM